MRNSIFRRVILAGVFVLLLPLVSYAVPQLINYQGRLTNSGGAPVTGDRSIAFNLYSTASGSTALWTETQTVAVTDGLFSVLLGSVTPIPAGVFSGDTAYLGIRVGSDGEMTPRQRIASVGYSFKAKYADNAGYADSAGSAYSAKVGDAPFRVVRTSASDAPDATIDSNQHLILSNMSGVGTAGYFKIDNPSNASEALYAETNGAGVAFLAVNTGNTWPAGAFLTDNQLNDSPTIYAETKSSEGYCGEFITTNSSNSSEVLRVQTAGTGCAGYFLKDNASDIYGPPALIANGSNGYAALFNGGITVRDSANVNTLFAVWPTNNTSNFWTDVNIYGTLYKTSGSFVQPHPSDPSKEVVYAFFEGPEHAVFLRGTARLVDGRATIETPEYFRIVAGDEGITVQFTPRSLDSKGLAAYEVTKDAIKVGELLGGNGDYKFDYFITAKRAGFEAHEPVQANKHFSADGMTREEFEQRYKKTDMTTTAMRDLLISDGILNPDGTLNMDTVQRLGWKLKEDGTPATTAGN